MRSRSDRKGKVRRAGVEGRLRAGHAGRRARGPAGAAW